jgi:hypothetical protein
VNVHSRFNGTISRAGRSGGAAWLVNEHISIRARKNVRMEKVFIFGLSLKPGK